MGSVGRGWPVYLIVLLSCALLGPVAVPSASANASAPVLVQDQYIEPMLALMNGEREAAGLPRLALCADRSAVASSRAIDMASRGYFAHVNPDGIGPAELLVEYVIAFDLLGENIARSTYPADQVLDIVHRAFMDSAPHRANVLDPRFQQVGIAAALVGDMYYFAIVFTD
jgi:uncharacterized protein YkwD